MSRSENLFGKAVDILALAGGISIFNRIFNQYACRKHILTSSSENYYNWKGVSVYFEKKGSGEPVILLHALHPAASSYEWHRITASLAENHAVYSVDLPGCGRSDKPGVMYTNFYYVEFLSNFIRDFGLKGATVIASNLSSAIAVMLSEYSPDLVGKIILINPPSMTQTEEVPGVFSRLTYHILRAPVIGSLLYNVFSSRSKIDLAFSERYFYNPFHDTDDLVDAYFESAHLKKGHGRFFAACLYGKYINTNLGKAVKGLKIPVKIIEGSRTWGADEVIEEWLYANPQVESSVIEHTKELPMLEEPEKTVWEIDAFL